MPWNGWRVSVAKSPRIHSGIEEANKVFFVDIPPGTVYAYNPSEMNCEVNHRTRVTGGFTLQEDGSLLLFQDGRIALLHLDGTLREIAEGKCAFAGNDRFNDVIGQS